MYFGTKELHGYLECAGCRSLCIESIPSDLARYYGPGYGGHAGSSVDPPPVSGARLVLQSLRTDALLSGNPMLGRVVDALRPDYFDSWNWFRTAEVSRRSRILDVGCGGGSLLKALHSRGFENLNGADAFASIEVSIPRLKIRRQDVMQISGEFDLIMLHHSLEHMPDPRVALTHLCSLLAPNGVILIRVPVANCEAFRMFGVCWYQIDSPRHLHIPSVEGLEAIARRSSLRIFRSEFDSTPSQFVASQGYQMGIPLVEQRANKAAHVSTAQLQEFEARTKTVNAAGTGDQAAFYLRTTSSA
jgi:hypothetical protein